MDYAKEISALISEQVTSPYELAIPPDQTLGDYSLPCFSFAKEFSKNPAEIATDLASKIKKPEFIEKIETKGPYLNFFINKDLFAKEILDRVLNEGEDYGSSAHQKETILVESPGPNTNKPLHLGHLRNILLGASLSSILKALGNNVHIVNVVNDRGIHICKSMLAYQKFGEGKTPQSEDQKSDHFVGDYYVKYAQAAEKSPELEDEAQQLLIQWEQGKNEVLSLWKTMNTWALDGFNQTYKRLNFTIEKEYLESHTYKHGKEIILQGLEEGIFSKNEEGAIISDLEDKNLGKKVLLRANGTSVYITQDIYMAKLRAEQYSFDRLYYVVGNEQEHHFKVLFEVFKQLNFSFANSCQHFSYGMVELPDGKMKSRQGNVIDCDQLLDEVTALSKDQVQKRWVDLDDDAAQKRAEIIALAAIRYYFLKFDPKRNFAYNAQASLAFEGDTGPYLLYSYARARSILRKARQTPRSMNLPTEKETALLKMISTFPEKVQKAAEDMNPSLIANYAFSLSQTFNEFYAQCKVIGSEEEGFRLQLVEIFTITLKNALSLLCIDVIEQM